MDNQLGFYLAFNSINTFNSTAIMSILDFFAGDAEAAWHNDERWGEILQRKQEQLSDMLSYKRSLEPAGLYREYLSYGCGITYLGASDYPASLQDIYEPPLVLFYHGSLPKREDLCLSLIGSRRATPYGHQVAEILSRDLAYQGVSIVSGMARGIDSICHKGALAAGGKTIAILGTGLDVIYPRENDKLYAAIAQHGAVISEFPLGTEPLPRNFPRRNRIISGLSAGVVVIEADLNSGTIHTVNHALEQGRDVFAVPGPITSKMSRGTNKLIKECPSLVMVLSAEDIWQHYNSLPLFKMPAQEKVANKEGEIASKEQKLLELIVMPMQFDELAAHAELGIPAASLAATLTMLEIRGLVRQLPGKYYQAVAKNINR